MNILVYTSQADVVSKRLIGAIVKYTQGEISEIINTPESLITRLSQTRKDHTIVVLLANRKKELASMFSFRDFLEGSKLILILPDRKDQTISKGHKLYPRYISYIDSDFSDVGAVLKKMIANARLKIGSIDIYQSEGSEAIFEREQRGIERA